MIKELRIDEIQATFEPLRKQIFKNRSPFSPAPFNPEIEIKKISLIGIINSH